MRIFITGGTGYIGSHIVKQLVETGHTVRILAREPRRVTGLISLPGVEMIEGAIDDHPLIANALKGCDAVIHTVLNWGDSAVDMLRNDVLPALSLFEAAGKAGCSQAIFTSSTMALGEYRHDMHEEMKTRPLDYYGAGKASVENFMFAFSRKYPMRCNVVRPGLIIGRPAIENGKDHIPHNIAKLVDKALANSPIEITTNDGTQAIFGGDLARIYMAILSSSVNRQIYFGLGSRFVDNRMIIDEIVRQTESKSIISMKRNSNEDRPKLFDVTKIEREFGLVFDAWPEYEGMIREEIGRKS